MIKWLKHYECETPVWKKTSFPFSYFYGVDFDIGVAYMLDISSGDIYEHTLDEQTKNILWNYANNGTYQQITPRPTLKLGGQDSREDLLCKSDMRKNPEIHRLCEDETCKVKEELDKDVEESKRRRPRCIHRTIKFLFFLYLSFYTNNVLAVPEFKKEFDARYARPDGTKEQRQLASKVAQVKCNVCHWGTDKKEKTVYGQYLGRLIKKTDKKDKVKINKALISVEKERYDKGEPKFGELLKGGELPGKDIKESE